MDIYRVMYNYKGTVYQSARYYKSKEKADSIFKRSDDACAILWLKKKKGIETLMHCFEIGK